MQDQQLVYEPQGLFTLTTVPGSGNSDVAVTVGGTPQEPVYTIRQSGVEKVEGLSIDGEATSERTVIIPSVENLNADLGRGADRLQLRGDVHNSSIDLGGGNDELTVNGAFNNNNVVSGGGSDHLLFKAEVNTCSIDCNSGDDLVIFQSGVNGSDISLGTGNDVLRFLGNVTNTIVNLGGGQDRITIADPNADTTGLVIQGAGADDILTILTTNYKFVGDFTWESLVDPTDTVRFGPV